MGLWSFAVIYFFGLMVRRFPFFSFPFSVSFPTLSAEGRERGVGSSSSIDDDDRAFRGISNFDFNSVT